MANPSYDDEELAADLDEYLRALESGAEESIGPASSLDVAELREVVSHLHRLAELVGPHDPQLLHAPNPLPGSDLGKYRIKRELGEGGQSVTYLAFDPELERDVVIKLYSPSDSLSRMDQVLREGRALARIRSLYLAQCHDVGSFENRPFLVLEYVPGVTLEQYHRERAMSAVEIARLMEKLASGLGDIHRRGLVHRDLKPRNILIGDDGQPRIVDFGLVHSGSVASTGVSGTPAYMAPEQARGETGRIDERTDIFGLGAVFYELVTGYGPFHAPTREESLVRAREGRIPRPPEVSRTVPASLMSICYRCLEMDPHRRYSTADALREALRSWRRRRWATGLAAGLAGPTLLLGAALLLLLDYDIPKARTRPLAARTLAASALESPPRESMPDDVYDFFAIDGELRQDFQLSVEILGASSDRTGVMRLAAGDQIALRVQASRDCYLTVLSCGPDSPVQLYPLPPHETSRDAFVPAHQAMTIPGARGRPSPPIRATPSKGSEALCILASSEPVSLVNDADGKPVLEFRTEAQQAQLKARLRGFVRQPQSPRLSVSQVVVPYWVEESAAEQPAQEL